MKIRSGLRLGIVLFAAVFTALGWRYFREYREGTIPLIDRSDPAYTTALFHLERRATGVLMGRPNRSPEELRGSQLQIVQALARARLSQSAYEAQISSVTRGINKNVIISIPTYRWAGAKLKRHVLQEILQDTADAELRKRIDGFFFDFGTARQTLTVNASRGELEGRQETLYSITHNFSGPGANPRSLGSLGSRLPASHLVTYAPFQPLFPAP
jgi:hypothetical protein